MEGPSFQSFKKETIHNPLINQNFINNKTYYINKEESNSIPLYINRTSKNFSYPFFQVIYPSLSIDYLSSILYYVQSVLQKSIIEYVEFDCLKTYSTHNYNKDTIYIFDFTSDKIKNMELNPNSLSLFIFSILDKVGGIVAIGNSIEQFPKSFSTLSSIVFLDKNMPDFSKIVGITSFIRLNKNVIIDQDNICIDKLSLTTKVSSFSKI
jgi:hypothetical protein